MSSIKIQNAILDLFHGILDEDHPEIHLSTVEREEIEGGAPAIEAIEEIFKGGDADDDVEPNKSPIPADVIINKTENSNEEQVPEDDDGKEEVEKDGDGEPISDDKSDKDGDGEPISDDVEQQNDDKSDEDILMITGGSAETSRNCFVVDVDSKFPWIVKKKKRLD